MTLYQILLIDGTELARIRLQEPPLIGETLMLRTIAGDKAVSVPGDYIVQQIIRYYVGGLDESSMRKVEVRTLHSRSEVVDAFQDHAMALDAIAAWERSTLPYGAI